VRQVLVRMNPRGSKFPSKYEVDVEKIELMEDSDFPFRCVLCGSVITGARISFGSSVLCEHCMRSGVNSQ
jgi:hypothetical protein